MENNQKHEIEIDLKQIFGLLLSKALYIGVIGLVCAILAFSFFKFAATEKFTSTTQIFVIDKATDKLTSSDISMYSALSNDYIQLIQTRPVLEKVIAELGLDMNVETLKGKVTATKQGDSRIISISVIDESPVVAKRIADAVAKAAADQIYTVMDAELVNIVQPGNVPEDPSSPAVMRNTIIALILGVFVACAVIIIRYIMDDTIKTSEDVERYLGISVIGSIPIFGEEAMNDKRKKKRISLKNANSRIQNAKKNNVRLSENAVDIDMEETKKIDTEEINSNDKHNKTNKGKKVN